MKNTQNEAARVDDATPECSLREGAKLPALNPAKSIADWNEWGYRAKERKRGARTETDAQCDNITSPVVQTLFDASESLS